MHGENLYRMYARAMEEENTSVDDFEDLDKTEKNVWGKLEDRVNF